MPEDGRNGAKGKSIAGPVGKYAAFADENHLAVQYGIVLGLAPTDEETALRLDAMYTALESVVPLGYGLTPHITMAYFRPGRYGREQLQALRNALRPVALEVSLDCGRLVYQTFSNMNHYLAK